MHGIIYLLTNTRTNMQYVGQTILGLVTRWNGHVEEANTGEMTQIANAIRTYGAQAFTKQVLKTGVSASDLNRIERDYINHYGTLYSFGYNERLP